MRALLLLGIACFAPAGFAAAPGVALRAEAVVAGPQFSLGEVAAVDDPQLAALRIGHSPRAGAVLTLQRAEVQRALRRLAPQRGAVMVSGAERIVVRRGPLQALELARVHEAAARELRGALAARYARFEIEPATAGEGSLGVPEGRVELRARLPSLSPLPARVAVWIDIHVDERLQRSVPVSFANRAWQPVLAARRAVAPGEPLRAADFELREAQVAGAAAPLPADLDLSALRLKRPLAAGAALAVAHVERAPGVSKDQPVRVQVMRGAIGIETVAVATRDAAAGEVLRVRHADTNQTYPARVVAAGVVEALWR